VGGWVGELLSRAEEALVGIVPAGGNGRGAATGEAEEVAELRRVVKGLKRSVDGILLGGDGVGTGSLFR
jgi:nuclear pore complex protein Nup155